jgi:hypothetical protein
MLVDTVIGTVARHCRIRPAAVVDASRLKTHVRARRLAAYLLRKVGQLSYQEIATALGRKDHTGSMSLVSSMKKLIETSTEVASDVEVVTRQVSAELQNVKLGTTEGIWVPIPQQVLDRLVVLVESGCFGDSVADAIERIVSREVFELTGEIHLEVEDDPT